MADIKSPVDTRAGSRGPRPASGTAPATIVENSSGAPAKDIPGEPASYLTDYYAWCLEQAVILRQAPVGGADVPNIAEELEDMGRSLRHALASHYCVLLTHLLKWEFQPERRSRSWRNTIRRTRNAIERQLEDNKTLRNMAAALAAAEYARARREAAGDTGLPIRMFPAELPYSLDLLHNHDAFPGSSWAPPGDESQPPEMTD